MGKILRLGTMPIILRLKYGGDGMPLPLVFICLPILIIIGLIGAMMVLT